MENVYESASHVQGLLRALSAISPVAQRQCQENAELRQQVARLQEQTGELERERSVRAEEDRCWVPEWKICPDCGEPWRRDVDGEWRCYRCDG
jgi:hypothetical protein